VIQYQYQYKHKRNNINHKVS